MRITIALALLACVLTTGCKTTTQFQGSTGEIEATYFGSDLNATLPGSTRVPAVTAAAEEALAARGQSVYRRDVTESSGTLYAQEPDAGALERTVVHVRTTREGTKITITFQPWGDDARSRSLLDDILQRLGM